MSKYSVIITAGGIGKRMGASLPKQFILVKDKPILMYTIEKFYHFDPKAQLIITLPEEWRNHWEDLVEEHDFRIPHRVVVGGAERYDSIKNALEYCHSEYVAVHDGVRPLVSDSTIKECFEKVRKKDAVIPVVDLKDSIRLKEEGNTKAVDRSQYLTVQTPQCFKREVLEEAYSLPFDASVTDDACLVERLGKSVFTVSGNDENIKITTKSDLALAEQLLK
jgi:2-C-methyl-D-erythritol 4-phosphate cytidylyltransferase